MQHQHIKKSEQTQESDSNHTSMQQVHTESQDEQYSGLPLYLQRSQSQLLQRQPLEEEDEELQAKCDNCATHQQALEAEEKTLQDKSANDTAQQHLQKKQAIQTKPTSHSLQAKLKIGAPNDKYEQEADRVADEVMRMPDATIQRQINEEEEEESVQTKSIANAITPLVQRQVEPEEDEESEKEEEEEPIQTKSIGNNPTAVTTGLRNQIQSLKGGGQPLPGSERRFLEPRFGADFGNVRVHTDNRAAHTAQSINARAFTLGHDIVFGAGQYSPGSHPGRSLLAHELTHVVQQSGQQRFVQRDLADELGVTPSLDLLARQLEDDREDDAINTFRTLPGPDTDAVLRNRRWRNLAMSAFNNAEMHRAMMATGQRGLLFSKLLWEFDEGTNWNQLRSLIHRAPRPQRRQVITESWFRSQFISECGNETMGIAVRLLGPPLRNQLDWMIEEGVDETQFSRLIEESIPSEMHAASSDTTLMTRLRGELGDSSPVVSALEAARHVSPRGTTPVGPRWRSADVRMLSTQTARIGIISPRMAIRVPGAITALSEANYTAFRNLLTAAGSDTERAFICKALVSGHTIAEITTFAGTIHGMSDAWLLQNLNVFQVSSAANTAAGTGIIQQFGNSCGPASVQMIRADADPIYALSLNSAGSIGTAPPSAVSNPASITNAPLASEQSTILTTHAAAGTGIAPTNRVTPSGGAWVEADMNARRAATGVQYTRRDIGSGFTIDDALAVINVNLGMGIDVPIIVGSGPGSFAHYVVVVRKAGHRYQIHDVWNGQTVWRTARDFRLSQLNLPSSHVAISAMAEPRLVR